ncbi:hypothetical protein BDQ17DRAFT_1253944 [Cyathus striatus]|nr:hypothetical protein BDQ17DRAFT_1253944 [Cyathus striatus]
MVILEANSAYAAGWLWGKDIMLSFIFHFDGSSTMDLSLFSVVAKFVPTSFHPSPSYDFGDLETNNGLWPGTVAEAKPLKDPGYWKEDQCFAHFLLAFSDQQSTNRAIFNGLVIEGARI